MRVSRLSFVAETLVCDFKRCSCRKHCVCEDEGLSCQVRSAAVLDVDMEVLSLVVLSVCRYECVLSVVEVVQDTLMERKPSAENCGYDDLVVRSRDVCYAQRGHVFLMTVFQMLADLISEDLSEPFEVSAETLAVLLDSLVAHLCDEFVENGILLTEVDDFHILLLWYETQIYLYLWKKQNFQHLTTSSSAKL